MESVPPCIPLVPTPAIHPRGAAGGFFVVRAAHGQGRWKVLENDYPGGGIPHPITDGELVEEYLGFLTPRAEGPALRAVLKRFVVLRRVEPQAPTAVSCSKAHPERLPLVPCLIFHAPPRASWDHLDKLLAFESLSQGLLLGER